MYVHEFKGELVEDICFAGEILTHTYGRFSCLQNDQSLKLEGQKLSF